MDLRESLGDVRDQSPTGWCYAHSAADLVSQAVGRRVSAVDLAAAYLLEDEERLVRSSDRGVQRYLGEHPEFRQRLLRWRLDAPESYAPDRISTENGLFNIGGMDDDAILLRGLDGFCEENSVGEGAESNQRLLGLLADRYRNRDPRLDGERSAPIGAISPAESRIYAHLFKEWLGERCPKRIRPPSSLIPESWYAAGSLAEAQALFKDGKLVRENVVRESFRLVDAALEQGRPVAIGFDANEIYPSFKNFSAQEDGDHSSVIAARRWNGKQCLYNLRVHYGTDCSYREPLRANCDADGSVWLSRDDLASIYAVLWLAK